MPDPANYISQTPLGGGLPVRFSGWEMQVGNCMAGDGMAQLGRMGSRMTRWAYSNDCKLARGGPKQSGQERVSLPQSRV